MPERRRQAKPPETAPEITAPKITAPKTTAPEITAPEIEVRYSVAGRETLATIAAELLPGIDPEEDAVADASLAGPDAAHRRSGDAAEGPQTAIRDRQNTLNYGDRISNAPGARRPSKPTSSLPELAPEAESGKFTKEPAPRARQETVPIEDDQPFDVYEMATFVVRGTPAELASQTARRRFVEERLIHRLPVSTIDEVDRVDVTPWTVRGTLVVRVWCRVPERNRQQP